MAEALNVGLVGLGRMGIGIAERLVAAGHRVAAFDLSPDAREAANEAGATTVETLADLPGAVAAPRILWLMVPAGPVVDTILFDGPEALAPQLAPADIVIDGGNSSFRDSMRRAERLAGEFGVTMLDCGTSGGVEGARIGYCLMVGGPADAFEACQPALECVAIEGGCAHVGPSGAGHFVKMVHNAMEYAFLQTLGEGFSMIAASDFAVDMPRLADLWNHGSVVRSWLMELAGTALGRPDHFERIMPKVGGGSTGTWAVDEAKRMAVPVPSIELALKERGDTPSNPWAARMVAALRWEFGRHPLEMQEV